MLDEDRLREDEYEKQYYGFNSTELYVDLREETSKALKFALAQVGTALETAECDEVVCEQKISELYTAFMNSAETHLERLKNEARKVFAIPKNVVLDEDQYKGEKFSDEDIIKLKKEVAELEQELLREEVFLAKCKQQKEFMDTKLIPTYEKLNSISKSFQNLHKDKGDDEYHKKLINLHEEHVQYYFDSDGNKTEKQYLPKIECDFIKSTDDFLSNIAD